MRDPDILKIVYSGFYPCKMLEHPERPPGTIWMAGYSEQFDEVEDGNIIPTYEGRIEGDKVLFEKA